MKLNIILTSYNRPRLLQMAIDGLEAQTDDRWHCFLQDDNSNESVQRILDGLEEAHFTVGTHDTTEHDRKDSTRYSVLINEILPGLEDGIACTMCDNVTYEPDLVKTVLTWFEAHPEAQSAYVPQTRDMYHLDGEDAGEYMGWANEFGHWLLVPPQTGRPITTPYGILDHSQVMHRLPVEVKWSEDIAHVSDGDADFYIRLIEKRGPIECITTKTLSCEHLLYEKIHGHG